MLLYFWLLYLIIFPFQIFSPGSLQLADYVIIIGLIINHKQVFKIGIKEKYSKILIYFCIYALLVGSLFSVINLNFIFLKNPLNYIYCLLLLFFVITASNSIKFLKYTYIGIFASTLFQVIVLLVFGIDGETGRMQLFFNNPNQLGFWGVNMFLILILLKTQTPFFYKYIYIPISLCVLFILISISQAAILCILLYFLFFIFLYFRKRFILSIILFLSIIIFSIKFYDTITNFVIVKNAIDRIDDDYSNDELDDNGLEGRNYLRLINYPQYLIIGSGEGKNERFGNKDMNEIHSSFANILFSYGFIGLILFIFPYLYILKSKNNFLIFCLLIYFVFTIVHSTLRWPLFWILPYLTYHINLNKKYVRN